MITTQQLDASVYQRAERLLQHNRASLVLGGEVRPRWIEGGARFWYVVGTAIGKRFVLVDPRAGIREPAFDHERLTTALAAVSRKDVAPDALPFSAIELTSGAVEFDAFGAHWRCRLDTYDCERAEARPAPVMGEVRSPDGKLAVFRRGYDLWARSLVDGREWALTTDGEQDYDYATVPDAMKQITLLSKLGVPDMPAAVAWSPDSTRVLVPRTDQRGVRQVHLIENFPDDGGAPRLLTKRDAYAGDNRVPLTEFLVIDLTTGAMVRANADPVQTPYESPILRSAWWSADGSAVYYLAQPRDLRILHLHRLDPATGEVSTVLTETGDTRVEANQFWGSPPIVRVLPSGKELLWYSQRDGWGHLYRYDARSGELLGQLTSGQWAVREILHVDETHRVVYFLASGLISADPYRRSVCRVGLDGTGLARVSTDELDHAVTVAENGEYFLDSASTTDTPPVITVRGWDGQVIVELERADITRLLAAGWTPSERFKVIAADGHTDIYGVLHLPPAFDPTKSYPVIDHPYPGPQTHRVGPAFYNDSGIFSCTAEAIAALGFVVVAVDGRGTPGRSKAFHDACYRGIFEVGGADHVATLQQLAGTRPWMDLDRVGIVGLSAGGYATVRAMLDHPEVYKVGVAGCGSHDNRTYHLSYAEMYQGPYDPQTYSQTSNIDDAARLQGKLLLIHGGRDDNTFPHQTLRLADRLIAANKDFDMFLIPGADHRFFGYEHYLNQRTWDFLVRHVLRAEPPDYRLTPTPLDADLIAEYFN